MAGITQKSCLTFFPLWYVNKLVVGYIDVKQQETYETLKKTTTTTTIDNNNNDDNNAANTATTTTITASTNKCHNRSNNYDNNTLIIIKIIIIIMKNEKWLCIKKIKIVYIHCSPHFLFGEENSPYKS